MGQNSDYKNDGYFPQLYGDVYNSVESTITNGTTNSQVTHANVTNITYLKIYNETSGKALTVRFNANTNDTVTVPGATTREWYGCKINSIFLSNSSGSTITYDLEAWGNTDE